MQCIYLAKSLRERVYLAKIIGGTTWSRASQCLSAQVLFLKNSIIFTLVRSEGGKSVRVDDIGWRQRLVFIHNSKETKRTWGMGMNHPWMTPNTSPRFLRLRINSWESASLIGIYLRLSETLGFGLGVMVAEWKQFEQSVSRLGRHVQTLIGHCFRLPCGLVWAQTNSKKVGKYLRQKALSGSVNTWL